MQEGLVKNIGISKDGKFQPYNKTLFDNCLREFDGKIVEVFIQEREEETTDNQRGYFFGVIVRKVCMNMEQFGGWSATEIYEFFCGLFLSEPKSFKYKKKSIVVSITRSLSKLNKKETSIFIQKVINWLAQECGVEVPEPSLFYIGKEVELTDNNGTTIKTFVPAKANSRSKGEDHQ